MSAIHGGVLRASRVMMLSILAVLDGSAVFAVDNAIGLFTEVQGAVTVSHPAIGSSGVVKFNDDVFFKDIIETQRASRTKALFQDDTLLTLAENSRVEITQHIYDPSQNRRSAILFLARGAVRALVGRVFSGMGSKFEVHTGNAVAAARGTYFVVWIESDLSTGMVNIGNKGDVAFTAQGETVVVKPGQYSLAKLGAAPFTPVSIGDPSTGSMETTVDQMIQATELKDSLLVESPKALLHAVEATMVPVSALIPRPAAPSTVQSSSTIDGDVSVPAVNATASAATTAATSAVAPVVSPVTAAVTSVVTPIVSSVTTAVTSALAPIVSPVTAAVTSVITPLSPVTPAIAPVVSPVTTVIAPVIAPIVSPVTPVVAPVIAPIVSPVTTVIAPIVSPVTTVIAPTITPILSPVVPSLGAR
jgi:hypothetical protein